ncbi:MAG TPA: AI-2E family transporter [Caulobacteraceae bacterium]|nr:AI-2E family transporter [Caulobacteraceae bacterium]
MPTAAPSRSEFGAFARRVLFVVLAAALAWIGYLLHHVLLLGFGAVLVAVLLRALADPIRRRTRLDAAWSLGVTALALFILIGGIVFFVGASVGAQMSQLGEALPEAIGKADQEISRYQWGQWLLERVHEAPKAGVDGLAPLAGWLAHAGQASVTAVAEVIVVIVAGVYLAAQPALYVNGLLLLFPQHLRPTFGAAFEEMGLALRKWLLGTGAAMLAMGVLTTIGASLLHLPAPLALGLLSGLAEFVPVVGAAVSAIPALLLAATQGPSLVLWTLAFYVGVHQFEGHVLIPLIQRKVVAVPPAMTLFSILGFGVLFGPVGIIFATPLAVVLMVLVKHLHPEAAEKLAEAEPETKTHPVGARGKV